eukprot:g1643.t1 g1643   contig10:2492470-2495262(-)
MTEPPSTQHHHSSTANINISKGSSHNSNHINVSQANGPITLTPSSILEFQLSPNPLSPKLPTQATFSIQNTYTTSSSSHIAYKFTTNRKNGYITRPCFGILSPGGKETVVVTLMEKARLDVLKSMADGNTSTSTSDKLRVEIYQISPSFASLFSHTNALIKNNEERMTALKTVWKDVSSGILFDQRIMKIVHCVVDGKSDGGGGAAPVVGGRSGANLRLLPGVFGTKKEVQSSGNAVNTATSVHNAISRAGGDETKEGAGNNSHFNTKTTVQTAQGASQNASNRGRTPLKSCLKSTSRSQSSDAARLFTEIEADPNSGESGAIEFIASLHNNTFTENISSHSMPMSLEMNRSRSESSDAVNLRSEMSDDGGSALSSKRQVGALFCQQQQPQLDIILRNGSDGGGSGGSSHREAAEVKNVGKDVRQGRGSNRLQSQETARPSRSRSSDALYLLMGGESETLLRYDDTKLEMQRLQQHQPSNDTMTKGKQAAPKRSPQRSRSSDAVNLMIEKHYVPNGSRGSFNVTDERVSRRHIQLQPTKSDNARARSRSNDAVSLLMEQDNNAAKMERLAKMYRLQRESDTHNLMQQNRTDYAVARNLQMPHPPKKQSFAKPIRSRSNDALKMMQEQTDMMLDYSTGSKDLNDSNSMQRSSSFDATQAFYKEAQQQRIPTDTNRRQPAIHQSSPRSNSCDELQALSEHYNANELHLQHKTISSRRGREVNKCASIRPTRSSSSDALQLMENMRRSSDGIAMNQRIQHQFQDQSACSTTKQPPVRSGSRDATKMTFANGMPTTGGFEAKNSSTRCLTGSETGFGHSAEVPVESKTVVMRVATKDCRDANNVQSYQPRRRQSTSLLQEDSSRGGRGSFLGGLFGSRRQ